MFNSCKTLFLIDGAGALLTALLVGFVLPRLVGIVGIPVENLYLLSAVGLLFALYSFSCYFFVQQQAHIYLGVIAFANVLYCCATIALVYFFSQNLSIIEWFYFVGELIVVGILVGIELKTVWRS